ncbi:MAG: hypothetical protein QXP42_05275 [Candidatus Micrarchaeia archaeon]
MELPNIYEGDYKRLMLLPALMLLAAFLLIPRIPQGVDLRGGTLITIQTNSTVDTSLITQKLKSELGATDIDINAYPAPLGGNTVEIQIEQNEQLARAERDLRTFYKEYEKENMLFLRLLEIEEWSSKNPENTTLKNELEKIRADYQKQNATLLSYAESLLALSNYTNNATNSRELKLLVEKSYSEAKENYRNKIITTVGSLVKIDTYSFKDITPSLSEFFLKTATIVIVTSFLLSALVVFLIFRSFVPSLAVIIGVFSDIITALGAMGLFGIPLTLPSFAALLMLIGYSLDTNVLLTTRVLKRSEGNARQRAYETLKTGLTMTSTAIVSFSVLLLLSIITHIPTYYQIASVAVSGLFGDIMATWLVNAPIILSYAEKLEQEGKM